MDKDIALGFCQEKDPNKISVLLMIDILKNTNLFVLDRESYHAYCAEREVLLQEGLQFKVNNIQKSDGYTLVHLIYQ